MLPYFGGMQNGYEMFDFPHGVTVDYQGNVWVGNNTAEDSRLVKFDQNGKFLLQIGTKGVRGFSNDTENLGGTGNVTVDPVTNEAYIADGRSSVPTAHSSRKDPSTSSRQGPRSGRSPFRPTRSSGSCM